MALNQADGVALDRTSQLAPRVNRNPGGAFLCALGKPLAFLCESTFLRGRVLNVLARLLNQWEFATLSFPGWHLAHTGCQLPDAILHGKRSYRPHSRAVQRLAVAEFRVRPLSPLELAIAVAGLRTRERHVCDCVGASLPFAPGRPPLLAARWPGATGLAS